MKYSKPVALAGSTYLLFAPWSDFSLLVCAVLLWSFVVILQEGNQWNR